MNDFHTHTVAVPNAAGPGVIEREDLERLAPILPPVQDDQVEQAGTDDSPLTAKDIRWPQELILLRVSVNPTRWQANNVTTLPPDPMEVNLLACFPSEADIDWYLLIDDNAQVGQADHIRMSLERARQEAKDRAQLKPRPVHGLGLWIAGHLVDIHYTQ